MQQRPNCEWTHDTNPDQRNHIAGRATLEANVGDTNPYTSRQSTACATVVILDIILPPHGTTVLRPMII